MTTLSDATKTALDDALAAHIADTSDGILTGYVIQTSYFSTETDNHGTTGYYTEVADGQPWHVGKGLSEVLKFHYEQLFYEDDDDE